MRFAHQTNRAGGAQHFFLRALPKKLTKELTNARRPVNYSSLCVPE